MLQLPWGASGPQDKNTGPGKFYIAIADPPGIFSIVLEGGQGHCAPAAWGGNGPWAIVDRGLVASAVAGFGGGIRGISHQIIPPMPPLCNPFNRIPFMGSCLWFFP